MTVFFYNLKRLFKRKSTILTMFLLPVIVMVLTVNLEIYRTTVKIAVIDKDRTKATRLFTDEIKKNNILVNIDEKDIQNALCLQKIDYAVVIDKGFTSSIITGKAADVKTYYDAGSNISKIVDVNVQNYINLMKNKAEYAKGDQGRFYSGLKCGNTQFHIIEVGDRRKYSIRMTLAFLIMFMLIFSAGNTKVILKENGKDILLRTIEAPISTGSYIFQCILSLFFVTLMQVNVVFIIMAIYFKSLIVNSIFSFYIIFVVFSGVSVALNVFISNAAKRVSNLGMLSGFIAVPLCMLGGCFWSTDMMPEGLQRVSCLIPITWAVNAVDSIIIKNYNLLQVKEDIIIMLMFIIVFLLLGVKTKKDIIN